MEFIDFLRQMYRVCENSTTAKTARSSRSRAMTILPA